MRVGVGVGVVLLVSITIGWLTGCSAPNPIDTSNPVDFRPEAGVFTIQVPDSWAIGQQNITTESMAFFTDPTDQVNLVAYTGLLERRLADEEGLSAVTGLAQALLAYPADFEVTQQARLADGAFEMSFAYSREDQKIVGDTIFRDTDLALSGVILFAPEAMWNDVQSAMQPFVDSFELDAEAVQGTFFVPLVEPAFAMAIPDDWQQQRRDESWRLTARNGRMSMMVLQGAVDQPLDAAALAEAAAGLLRATFGLRLSVSGSRLLEDGRLNVSFDSGDRQVIGYVEQIDDRVIGLFFDVPADRVADYQPFIDFEYFTFVTDFEQ
jgi:hypothetical protein